MLTVVFNFVGIHEYNLSAWLFFICLWETSFLKVNKQPCISQARDHLSDCDLLQSWRVACSFIILTTTAKSARRSPPNRLFCYMISLSDIYFPLPPFIRSRLRWSNSHESLMNPLRNVPRAGWKIIGSSLEQGLCGVNLTRPGHLHEGHIALHLCVFVQCTVFFKLKCFFFKGGNIEEDLVSVLFFLGSVQKLFVQFDLYIYIYIYTVYMSIHGHFSYIVNFFVHI